MAAVSNMITFGLLYIRPFQWWIKTKACGWTGGRKWRKGGKCGEIHWVMTMKKNWIIRKYGIIKRRKIAAWMMDLMVILTLYLKGCA